VVAFIPSSLLIRPTLKVRFSFSGKKKVSRPWQREVGGWNGWTQKRTGGASSSPSVLATRPSASFLLFLLLVRTFWWLASFCAFISRLLLGSQLLWFFGNLPLLVSLARANSFFGVLFSHCPDEIHGPSSSSSRLIRSADVHSIGTCRHSFLETRWEQITLFPPLLSRSFFWTMSPLH